MQTRSRQRASRRPGLLQLIGDRISGGRERVCPTKPWQSRGHRHARSRKHRDDVRGACEAARTAAERWARTPRRRNARWSWEAGSPAQRRQRPLSRFVAPRDRQRAARSARQRSGAIDTARVFSERRSGAVRANRAQRTLEHGAFHLSPDRSAWWGVITAAIFRSRYRPGS